MRSIILVSLLIFNFLGCESFGFGFVHQNTGYVTVRQGAHMFWWLLKTRHSTERPLIIWLAGGPGASSTAFGNLYSVGPINEHLKYRINNWVNHFNLLFVDNPVGTGYSYVDDINLIPRNQQQIGDDLLELLRGFYKTEPDFLNVPLYIFGHGYGGKMALSFTKKLLKEYENNNLKGIILSNPWISSMDYITCAGDYLYNAGKLDQDDIDIVDEQVNKIVEHYEKFGPTKNLTMLMHDFFTNIEDLAAGMDGTDIHKKTDRPHPTPGRTRRQQLVDKLTYNKFFDDDAAKLSDLMNGPIKISLNIKNNIEHGHQSNDVYKILTDNDMAIPAYKTIEYLLNNTDVPIYIINGNDDLLALTIGQEKWIDRLSWNRVQEYNKAVRLPLYADDLLQGYYKFSSGLSFVWLTNAGHDAFNQNPEGYREALRLITGY